MSACTPFFIYFLVYLFFVVAIVCLFVYWSVCLVSLFVCLFGWLIGLFVLFICLFDCLFECLIVCLFVCYFISLFVGNVNLGDRQKSPDLSLESRGLSALFVFPSSLQLSASRGELFKCKHLKRDFKLRRYLTI